MVYKASVDYVAGQKTYIGLAGTEFKVRYRNHKSSFNNQAKKKSTALASHIHQLKADGKDFELKWRIIDRAKEPKAGITTCRLCLKEARAILKAGTDSLNKRSEITGACRHVVKFYFDEWDPKKVGID